jgi:hypothetical protein
MMRLLLLVSILATHYHEVAQAVAAGLIFGRAVTALGAALAGLMLIRRSIRRRREQ